MASSQPRRIAIVVDRFGDESFGGASLYAGRLAELLGRHFTTEILTTTAEDYMTWRNVFAPGLQKVAGVDVRRFSVDHPRDVHAFDRFSQRLVRSASTSIELGEEWMRLQGPVSSELLDYLRSSGRQYDVVIFASYLYATTYFALPLVADRAILVPLAHDEWPLRFALWDRFFTRPKGFIYNTEEERDLVARRFPRAGTDGPVIGLGPGPAPPADARRFRAQAAIEEPFLLYVGRVDPSKGCDELLRMFARYRRMQAVQRDLVIIGRPYMPIPAAPGVHALGAVDEQTKWDALAACDALVLPSPYESLSLVVLEAWAARKPVLVNARAEAVVGQCRRSGGGLWYHNTAEFIGALNILDEQVSARLGAAGASYVERRYDPAGVEAAYVDYLSEQLDRMG